MRKFRKEKARNSAALGNNKSICRHDYKNAIQVGNVDYVCPLCKELLDPLEWFFMNSFEFVEVKTQTEVDGRRKSGRDILSRTEIIRRKKKE